MARTLRVDRIVHHAADAAYPDGRLEFHAHLGEWPLPLALSNDGLIFPGGLDDFREQLAQWVENLDLRERLFMLYMDAYLADNRLSLATLQTREGRTATLDDIRGEKERVL